MASPKVACLPVFDQAYVISDLHIGGEEGVQMFTATDRFAALVDHLVDALTSLKKRKASGRLLLAINGDFVDFLAEPKAVCFQGNSSVAMLQEIFARREFLPVLQALQEFVRQPGAHLVVTLGNHDVELALPDTRRTLLQLLTNNKPDLEGRVEFSFDGWGYRFQIGDRRAICLHGNEPDPFNFTRYDELDRIIHDLLLFDVSEFGENWCPNAGSWFVIQAINPIKRRFPFVDLLKPEVPLAATALAVLDPPKAIYAREVVQMAVSAAGNETRRPAAQRRMSSATSPVASSARLGPDDIVERTEHALENGTIEQLIHGSGEVTMLGLSDWFVPLRKAVNSLQEQALDLTRQSVERLTGAAREIHWRALRSAVRLLVTNDPYDLGELDSTDRKIDQTVRRGYDAVFAGHTHFRRLAQRSCGRGLYVNTGTWAGLIGLSREDVDSATFETVYDALRSADRRALFNAGLVRQECTVARMTMTGRKVNVALGGVTSDLRVEFTHERCDFNQ